MLTQPVKNLKPSFWRTLSYSECVEVRTGVFRFDYWRTLPNAVIEHLNLKELVEFDEQIGWCYAYEPKFETI